MRVFYGRAAFQLEFFALLGDRLPGTTGPQAAESLLGRLPEGLTYRPTRRRYPAVARRFPVTFARVPRRVAGAAAATSAWYRDSLDQAPNLDRPAATALLTEARRRLLELVTLQTTATVAGVQPVYDALHALVERTGVGDVATLSGGSGAEMLGLVGDLWRASRGDLDVDAVVRAHGFHGPLEGELSSRVWREDPAPLHRLVAEYARRPASEDPLDRERRRRDRAAQLRPRLLAALPVVQRPLARTVLALAAHRLPLRGVVKASLLQAFDVARAAGRQVGQHLVRDGILEDADDVFYLTVEELTGAFSSAPAELVRRRRERRRSYQGLDMPSDWRGTPHPTARADDDNDVAEQLTGIGVSPGLVQGIVRVVTDPADELEADEVLVASTTDPSWSSIIFISKALVVDIGGTLSHAAVVARELGAPCVVNTRTGTRALRTGDLVEVDGKAGTVRVLQRASRAEPGPEEAAHACH